MDPFGQAFDEKAFFPSAAHGEALARLDYAVRSRVPFAVLTGEVGCGKTFVWKVLVQRMPRDKYAFATFPAPTREFEELARSLCQAPPRPGFRTLARNVAHFCGRSRPARWRQDGRCCREGREALGA